MALLETQPQSGPTTKEIVRGMRRRQYLWPVLAVLLTLALTAAFLEVLPPLLAYGAVFAIALVRIVFFANVQTRATDQLRLSLETTAEYNALLSDRERTNREIADEAVQSLYGAALRLDSCLDRLQDEAGVRDDVDAAAEQLTEVIDQIRRYVLELQPLLPDDSTRLHSALYDAQEALSAAGKRND